MSWIRSRSSFSRHFDHHADFDRSHTLFRSHGRHGGGVKSVYRHLCQNPAASCHNSQFPPRKQKQSNKPHPVDVDNSHLLRGRVGPRRMAFVARALLYPVCKNRRQNRALSGRWRPSTGPCRLIPSPTAKNAVAVALRDGGHVLLRGMFSLPLAVHHVVLAEGELKGIVVAAGKTGNGVNTVEMKKICW